MVFEDSRIEFLKNLFHVLGPGSMIMYVGSTYIIGYRDLFSPTIRNKFWFSRFLKAIAVR